MAPRELYDKQHPDSGDDSDGSAGSAESAHSPSRRIGDKATRAADTNESAASKRAKQKDARIDEESAEDSAEESVEESADEEEDEEDEEGVAPSAGNSGAAESEKDESDKSGVDDEDDNSSTPTDMEELRADNKRLLAAEAALKREIVRLRAKCGEGADGCTAIVLAGSGPREESGIAQSTHSLAPMRSLTATASGSQDFSLALIMPKDYSTVDIPYHFKATNHGFPHRVQLGKTGLRQYVLESRIQVRLACQLVNRSNGDRGCTEMALPTDRPVRFKLELCFVATNEVVKAEDLKVPVAPTNNDIAEMRMVNGEVKWKFHAKFLSRHTKNPSGQEFFLKIRCLNTELERFALNATSVPFIVVSREVKPKKA